LLTRTLYRILGVSAGLLFNILNVCLAGNLPPFGAVCVIVQDQGRYLLFRSPEGRLLFPGGLMRWREHPPQAAERECLEETGLQVAVQNLIGYYTHSSKSFGNMSTLTLVFSGALVGGRLRGSVEGNPCWVEESKLLEMIDGFHRSMLDDYREQRDNHI
jgi:8-oxo-dGTP pyrophosphatase MutT (NUDIX family)